MEEKVEVRMKGDIKLMRDILDGMAEDFNVVESFEDMVFSSGKKTGKAHLILEHGGLED